MLTDRKGDDDGPKIDSVESMRKYIYEKKTKLIYSFVGDHEIGSLKVSVGMTGKTYKYVKIDEEVTKTLVGLPIGWANVTERNVEIKSIGNA